MVSSSIIFGLNPIYSIVLCGAAILGVPVVTLMPVSGVLLCDSPTLAITWPQCMLCEGEILAEAAQVHGDVSRSSHFLPSHDSTIHLCHELQIYIDHAIHQFAVRYKLRLHSATNSLNLI